MLQIRVARFREKNVIITFSDKNCGRDLKCVFSVCLFFSSRVAVIIYTSQIVSWWMIKQVKKNQKQGPGPYLETENEPGLVSSHLATTSNSLAIT